MHAIVRSLCLAGTIAVVSLSGTAEAGLFRAYLSVNGNDAYPCTVSQPCRLLPAALAAVNPGGEVWIVDSANFNTAPVNIDRSVTILAVPGALGSIVGNGGDAMVISTAGIDVTLRNLKILNLSGGVNGINMTAGTSLTVSGCEIVGFNNGMAGAAGIRINAAANVTVVDTTVRNNYYGIWFDGGANGTVSHTTVVNNHWLGVTATVTGNTIVNVTVNDSVASNNAYGFLVASGVPQMSKGRMSITRSTASNNLYTGFWSTGSTAVMTVSGSTASGNGFYGFGTTASGFRSLGDNIVFDNVTNDYSGVITLVAGK